MKRWGMGLAKLCATLIGMSGLRLDRGVGQAVLTFVLLVGSGLFWWFLPAERYLVFTFTAIVWLLYYGGFIAFFQLNLAPRLVARIGEKRAYQAYEIILGFLFYNQAACQLKMVDLEFALPGSFMEGWWFPAVPIILMGSGLIVKTWATMLAGLDVYYCRDMFTTRPLHDAPLTSGPYRIMANPMYGVGNLTAYGTMWLKGSLPGLVCAGIFQLSIYIFYLTTERPSMYRTYGIGKDIPEAQPGTPSRLGVETGKIS